MNPTTERSAGPGGGRSFEDMSVTVMIPAYNAQAFIRKALDSVLAQTRAADEIVVVDDGSTDATRAIVAEYGDRVRLMVQQNQGPSVARNSSIATMRTEFVAFIDADDLMAPTRLEEQLSAFAANPAAALCYNGMLQFNARGEERIAPAPRLQELAHHLRFHNPGITPSCMMVRRSAYLQAGGFNTALRGVDDWEFMVRMSRVGPFCCVDGPLTLYRLSDDSLSSNAERIYSEATSLIEPLLLNGLGGASRFLWRRRIKSYQAFKAALTLRACGKHDLELRYLLRSIALWPAPLWTPLRFKALAVTLKNRVS